MICHTCVNPEALTRDLLRASASVYVYFNAHKYQVDGWGKEDEKNRLFVVDVVVVLVSLSDD